MLPPPSPNLRDATRQTAAISSPVVIERRQNVAMQIRRVHDRDTNGVRLKCGSCAGERGKSTEQSCPASDFQEIAPRPGSVWERHCGVASADRLIVTEYQFQWKRVPTQCKQRRPDCPR